MRSTLVGEVPVAALAAKGGGGLFDSHDNIDAVHGHAFGRLGHAGDLDMLARDVDQLAVFLDEECW
ncbi:MAG: hypothetical protein WDM81_21955 [Rhizomicrobium sp.]